LEEEDEILTTNAHPGHGEYKLANNSFGKHLKGLLVCFPDVTTHCGCIFHSPVAGFSLLLFEVS
jgi:hypothetical protein